MELLSNSLSIAVLIFGFGFVVFFHELGHFLAAKWVGIKVEQFAVGFGHAVASWRKGMGFTLGSSGGKLEELQRQGADLSRYGETEYRLNWIPLGGYVKMLGQDDMNPNAQSDDPRSYNRKSIAARMLVVSAGVIMNVILAALLFMGLFLGGFHVNPPIIGALQTNSPAQIAGLQVGDRIVELGGHSQYDFKNLYLWTALAPADQDIPVRVIRDGRELSLAIRPQKDPHTSFLALGVGPVAELRGPDPRLFKLGEKLDASTEILPGDVVTAVNGAAVDATKVEAYVVFDAAVQKSAGKPVLLTVKDKDGRQREVKAPVSFFTDGRSTFFGDVPFNIAGLQPRPRVENVLPDAPAEKVLRRGDVITALFVNGDRYGNPTVSEFISLVAKAGERKARVEFEVEREGQRQKLDEGVIPTYRTGPGKRGVGIQPSIESSKPIVADVLEGSPASRARIPRGALITQVNGADVANWFDVFEKARAGGETLAISFVPEGSSSAQQATVELAKPERQNLENIRYTSNLWLREHHEVRKTANPLLAAAWGVTETRDLLLQFYVTLQRLLQGSVSASNFMGPIGIVHTGSIIATRGWDWLVWFLAMISANLAVVNFLPIPIVDGGLFTFLIIEKIVGKPLSPRMQTVAQLVGLAIILSVFLLVTYQDIARIWM